MNYIATLYIILFSITMQAQTTFAEANAQQLIDSFFEGFHKGDTVLMKSTIAPTMTMQTAHITKDGTPKVSDADVTGFLNAIANRPAAQVWKEELLDYTVKIDGTLAHVWTPYTFFVNGDFSHCGANAFTLAKIGEDWKIIHIIDSRRRDDCK